MANELNISNNPAASLWSAVLLRQVDDALIGPGDTSKNGRLLLIRQARAYLTTPSPDLEMVCTLAGLSMPAVIDRMRALIAKAPTPEELTSKRASRATVHRRKIVPAKTDAPKVYTLNGETRTVPEWSKITGISTAAICVRLASGWTIEAALTTDEAQHRARQITRRKITEAKGWRRGSPAKLLTHDGQTLTIAEWSQITGVKVGTIKSRLAKGQSVAEALGPVERRGKQQADAA